MYTAALEIIPASCFSSVSSLEMLDMTGVEGFMGVM